MEDLTPEFEELLSSSYKVRKALEQVLPKEAVDYILVLLAKDGAHRRLIKITEETENYERTEDHADKEPNQPAD